MMIGEDVSYVCADGRKGTYEAASQLIKSGRKRIAYIKGTDAYQVGLNRFEGYKQALEAAHLSFEETLVYSGDFKMADGYEAARNFMQQTNPPDAIMAATDFMAIGALKYLNEQQVSVPEKVAIVGFDNLASSAETHPPLTTIELPMEQLATRAIEALIHQIENDKTAVQQVFDCKFIIRQSS
jgi:LacI family transcriptional regulator